MNPTWQSEDGSAQLYLGDCMTVLPTLEAGSVEAILTDPPYQMRGGGGIVPIRGHGVGQVYNESHSVGEPWGYSLDWISAVAALRPLHAMTFCNSYMLGNLCVRWELTMQMGAIFVWLKPNAPPNCRNTPKWDCEFIAWHKRDDATNVRAREFRSQVLRVNFPQAGCFADERIVDNYTGIALHPTQKPMAIVLPFVDRLTEPAQTVLDPFMGTGTTGVACAQLGRRFIGIEIESKYFDIAVKRIAAAQMQLRLGI